MSENTKTHTNEFADEFLQDFIIETREHLESIQMDVLELETVEDSRELLDSLFRGFHSIKGIAGFVEQGLILELAHKSESILDLCRKDKLLINKKISNLILKSADIIAEICTNLNLLNDQEFLNTVSTFIKELEDVGEIKERVLEKKDKKSVRKKEDIIIEKSSSRDNYRKKNKEISPVAIDSSVIRIPTKKVDNLLDMMGELMITQSQMEEEAKHLFNENDNFMKKLLNVSRIMKEMQSISMSLRMVSLKSTFNKIARIARDTIDELAKDVEFQSEGEDTEIDRNIAEKILEPLVHLVKNSISHGIESPELRIERGKSSRGLVKVSAYSNRGSVYIEIEDDGDGINLDKIYKKALEKKLIEDSDRYTDKEILNFIFMPGFSTKESVNTVSGRGVGMDVVKTELSRIGGKIEIINKPGLGCTFILKIPINLAVMNGSIISIAGSKYIIPTLNIKEIVQVKDKNSLEIRGKKTMVKIREDLIPIIEVSNIFGKTLHKDPPLFLLLEMDKKVKALPVDSVIDRREIVVKPLIKEFSNLDYISGASILGDGKVAFILDVEFLFNNKFIY
ncbi:chemotaxis protein CheA [Natronospora cellulosivora (SeqCode)]